MKITSNTLYYGSETLGHGFGCAPCSFHGSTNTERRSWRIRPRGGEQVNSAFPEDCRELLRRTNSLKPNGEFKRWLSVWTFVSNTTSVIKHQSFPWVQLWGKPDFSEMKATCLITGFAHFPEPWEQFWHHINVIIEYHRYTTRTNGRPYTARTNGRPYWMLSGGPSEHILSEFLQAIEHRISKEIGVRAKELGRNYKPTYQARFFEALEPFRVFTPQQEIEDETIRASEERSHVVRVWNRSASNRPPRCR